MSDQSISGLSIFCWNIGNPSRQRAALQAEWLRTRPEDILVLTETKNSEGCVLLQRYFEAYGYHVVFPLPEGKEYGVMIVSKHRLVPSDLPVKIETLAARVATAKLEGEYGLRLMGVYVPSRDASVDKISRKRQFLKNLNATMERSGAFHHTILCGDLNILEPAHVPHYPFFEQWEYDFYSGLEKLAFRDAFRVCHPNDRAYSWVGRTGDGYRYDHCFLSGDLVEQLDDCGYVDEPRKTKLSDHSGMRLTFRA